MGKKTLGKIEKPSVEQYRDSGKRKLYMIPLFLPGAAEDRLIEYQNKLRKYWKQVESRISRLEEKMGKIEKVYHEMVDKEKEEGEKIIQQMSGGSWRITKELLDKGAVLRPVEDSQLIQEHFDWVRCLSIGFKTERARAVISSMFSESLKRRDEYISKRLDKDLQRGEIAVLFIRQNNFLEFPSDMEVFRILPPALQELRSSLEKLQNSTPFS